MPWQIFWAHAVQTSDPKRHGIFWDFIILMVSSSDSGENEVLFVKIGASVLGSWLYTSFESKEENNLPPITDWMSGVTCCISFTCSSTAAIMFMYKWVIPYKWQRCWTEQAAFIWLWSKRNIAKLTQLKNEGTEAWHTEADVQKPICSLLINIFIKKLMKVKNQYPLIGWLYFPIRNLSS